MFYRTWLARLLIVAGLLLLLGLYLHPVAVQGKIPADRDNLCFYYPLLTIFQWDGVPTWNPYELSGSSLVANPQAALFYPPNWILPFVPRKLGFCLATLVHYFWAGLGAYFLGRKLRLGRTSCFMAAVTFMLGGYLQSRILLRPLLLSAAWMPWALALFLGALESGSLVDSALAGIATAMTFLPGMYHNGIYTLALLCAAAVFVPMPGKERGPADVFGRIGLLLLAAGLGVGFASVSILPAAELLPHTVRSDFDYAAASTSSVAASDLPRVFCGFPRGPDLEEWNFFEKNAFPGWIGLVLSVVAVFRLGRRKGILPRGAKRAVVLLAVLFAGGLLVALGENTPVHRWLFQLPGGRFLNNPSRGLAVCFLSLSLLAGIGLEECDQVFCRWRRARYPVLYGLLILQIGGLFWYRETLNISYAFPPFHRTPAHLEFLSRARDEGRRIMTYDALRTVTGDFWPYHWPRFRSMLVPKIATVDHLEDIAGYDPLYIARYGEVVRSLAGEAPGGSQWRDVLPAEPAQRLLNLLSVGYILGEVNDHLVRSEELILTGIDEKSFEVDPAIGPCCAIRIRSALRGALRIPQGMKVASLRINGRDQGDQWTVTTLPLRAGVEVADSMARSKMGCSHREVGVYRQWVVQTDRGPLVLQNYDVRIPLPEVITPKAVQLRHYNQEGEIALLAVVFERTGDDFPFVRAFEEGEYRVYRNRAALPRGWLVFQVEEVSWPEGMLTRLRDPKWNPRESVLVEDRGTAKGVSGGSGKVAWKQRKPDTAELEVDLSDRGVLVLSEVFYPGWKALIDGEPVPIIRANGFLRGVVVPPGLHRVRLVYAPDGLLMGLGVVVACVAVLVALMGILWWSRRKEVATLAKREREGKWRSGY